ncbi:hypothetical protein FNV43_RR10284 [Rhamnella rubrinervis]|uniref:Uncharacterized protein n=1 Tax=Rhamnella rubrinervis TaxID=2594499 RepID=A0A8K0ML66_9ROSA|nr:hypothetical protein FNV43_RR10284 [Rhamnella rubrinervis]
MEQLISSLLCGLCVRRGAPVEEPAAEPIIELVKESIDELVVEPRPMRLVAQGLEVPPIAAMSPDDDEDPEEDEDPDEDFKEDPKESEDFLASKDSPNLVNREDFDP